MSAARRRPEFSQHFLRRRELATRLVASASISHLDHVVEVGPGRGMLTAALLDTGARVTAVEIDPDLAEATRARLGGRVEVVVGDFLAFEVPRDARVVANLPFGITARAVRHIRQSEARDAHLIVQREAAERFAGAPWGAETLPSLELKPWWHVEILRPLRRSDFDPPPSVDCAYLWLARRNPTLIADPDVYGAFLRDTVGRGRTLNEALRRVFSHAQIEHLRAELRLPVDAPPTHASFEQWLALFRAYARLNEDGQTHIADGRTARTSPAGSPGTPSRRGRRAAQS